MQHHGQADARLYIFGGLPGSGETTMSQLLASRVGAAHVRIDTIEQALRDLCAVAGARYVNIEVVCSDVQEHRRRVVSRHSTVPGLIPPTWQEVVDREYDAWTKGRIVLDTAGRSKEDCLESLLNELTLLSPAFLP